MTGGNGFWKRKWKVIYVVSAALILIVSNVLFFVSWRQKDKERSRESGRYTVYPHYTEQKMPPELGMPRYTGEYSGTIKEIYYYSPSGEKVIPDSISRGLLADGSITVWLRVGDGYGEEWFYSDNNTAFMVDETGKAIDVLNTGDEISFFYAEYDDINKLILIFRDGSRDISEDDVSSEDSVLAVIFTAAVPDLVAVMLFVCIFIAVNFIVAGRKKLALIPLAISFVCIAVLIFLIFAYNYLYDAVI